MKFKLKWKLNQSLSGDFVQEIQHKMFVSV